MQTNTNIESTCGCTDVRTLAACDCPADCCPDGDCCADGSCCTDTACCQTAETACC